MVYYEVSCRGSLYERRDTDCQKLEKTAKVVD